MENFEQYAPYIVIILSFIASLKIYARVDEVKELETRLMKYALEHFVTRDVYQENHNYLQTQMTQIRDDVSEVKNLLITMINKGK